MNYLPCSTFSNLRGLCYVVWLYGCMVACCVTVPKAQRFAHFHIECDYLDWNTLLGFLKTCMKVAWKLNPGALE